jgi:hypothetical protein
MQTLTELVADRLGPGRPLTYDKFEEQAIDERTGYRPSRGVLWKVAHGKKVHIDPPLIRAIAAGLRIPEAQVQAAAAYQFLGLVVTQTAEGIALTMPGTKDPDTDAVLRQAERARNEGEDDSN